jgi:hypothetical protein
MFARRFLSLHIGDLVGVGGNHAHNNSVERGILLGCDRGEPVSAQYHPRGNEFTGKIKLVQINIDNAAKNANQMIGAEERFNLAMARQ